MSLAGLKKQFNKTSQYLSEKVGGHKGSELDEQFIELGRKLDVVNECVETMQGKTNEYLQPNPTARTKMAMQSSYQKVRGQVSTVKYPQPEFNLGEVFSKFAGGLNDMSPYALSLVELGSSFNELSEAKDSMEFKVKQNFLDPLFEMQQKDLKEISQHRKKLESRRLDYDYKKNKGEKVLAEELQAAEDKFIDSKELCHDSMMNFVENDVEHITQLHAFAEIIHEYHKQCAEIMGSLTQALSSKLSEAASQPRKERPIISSSFRDTDNANTYDVISIPDSAPPSEQPPAPVIQKPCCRALYEFEAENEGELPFMQDDMIELISRIDENWLEGSCNGVFGYFPENFVEIVVPI